MAIPSEAQIGPATRHVDTDILRGILDSTGKDDLYSVGKHLANSAKKTDPLGVSIPAIGEAFHGLSENTEHDDEVCRNAATTLRELVRKGRLVLVGVGGKEVYFKEEPW